MTNGTDDSTNHSAEYGGFVFGEEDGSDTGSDREADDRAAGSERPIVDRVATATTLVVVVVVLAVVIVTLGQISGGGDLLGSSPAGVEDGTGDVLRGVKTPASTDTTPETAVARRGGGPAETDAPDARTSRSDGVSPTSRASRSDTGGDSGTGTTVASGRSPALDGPTIGDTTTVAPSAGDRTTTEPRASGEDTTMTSDTTTANSDDARTPGTVTPGERSPSIESLTVTHRRTDDGNATVVLVIDWRVADPDGDLEEVRVSLRDGDGSTRRIVARETVAVGGANASGDTTFAVGGSSETPYGIAVVVEDRGGATALRIERAVVDGDDG